MDVNQLLLPVITCGRHGGATLEICQEQRRFAVRFNGICIVTDNVPRLSAFYREILKLEPEDANIFEIIPTEGAVLSIYSSNRTENAAPGCLEGSGNGRYTIEFEVEDVDREFERLTAMDVEVVKPPQPSRGGAGPSGFAIRTGTS